MVVFMQMTQCSAILEVRSCGLKLGPTLLPTLTTLNDHQALQNEAQGAIFVVLWMHVCFAFFQFEIHIAKYKS